MKCKIKYGELTGFPGLPGPMNEVGATGYTGPAGFDTLLTTYIYGMSNVEGNGIALDPLSSVVVGGFGPGIINNYFGVLNSTPNLTNSSYWICPYTAIAKNISYTIDTGDIVENGRDIIIRYTLWRMVEPSYTLSNVFQTQFSLNTSDHIFIDDHELNILMQAGEMYMIGIEIFNNGIESIYFNPRTTITMEIASP